MKTKKPKRRYENARQIRDDIDRYVAKRQHLLVQAEKAEDDAKFFRSLGPQHIEHANFLECQAKRLRTSAARISDTKLVYLKNKLGEWLTEPLPNVGINDRSIQA